MEKRKMKTQVFRRVKMLYGLILLILLVGLKQNIATKQAQI
jgi:hypothetical protein